MSTAKVWKAYFKANVLQPRFLKFALVGSSGIVVNMGFLFLFTEILNTIYWISSMIAIEISIISNFFLNDLWTWNDRSKKALTYRFIQYHLSVGLTAVLINWLLLIILTEIFGIYYLLSNLIGIILGTLSNFILNDVWTFKEKRN